MEIHWTSEFGEKFGGIGVQWHRSYFQGLLFGEEWAAQWARLDPYSLRQGWGEWEYLTWERENCGLRGKLNILEGLSCETEWIRSGRYPLVELQPVGRRGRKKMFCPNAGQRVLRVSSGCAEADMELLDRINAGGGESEDHQSPFPPWDL